MNAIQLVQFSFGVCWIGLLVLSALQLAFSVAFWIRSRNQTTELIPEERLPKVAVIVGLRGADPFLDESLTRLLTLSYPRYEVQFVLDSRADPAWTVVDRVIRETGAAHAHVEEYRHDPAHGLVNSTNSKVVQAVRNLDESVEVIAMMDGDAMPRADWLRDLVTPLVLDDTIGATFGNRWFVPNRAGWGALCRYVWNTSVVPPMDLLGMPWGGCYAIRASIVREERLADEWSRQIALDAASKTALGRRGLSLRFVPQLMILNREECSIAFCINFVRRQLTWTRLYHPSGNLAILRPLLCGLFFAGTLLSILVAAMRGRHDAVLNATVCVGLYCVGVLASLTVMEGAVRRCLRDRCHPRRWITPQVAVKLLCAIPLVVLVDSIAAFQARFLRRVRWRGLLLEIRGPADIRVVDESAMNPPISTDAASSC